jgi:hypothetical protein
VCVTVVTIAQICGALCSVTLLGILRSCSHPMKRH